MVDSPLRRTPRQPEFVVKAVVILVSGIVIGCGGTVLWLKHKNLIRTPRGGGPPEPNSLVADWQEKYGLTDDQVTQVSALIRSSFQKRRMIFGEARRQMESEDDLFVEAMREILSPEQFASWHEDDKERRKRRGRRGRFGGRRGPPRDANRLEAPNPPTPNELQ